MNRILITTLLLLLASSAAAEQPENYIKYRQAMMKAIGGHMSAISQLVRGKVANNGDLAMHASALAALNKDLTRLFPEGSDFGETQAKAVIWDEWEKFDKAAGEAAKATAALADAASGGADAAQIAAAHKAVGQSCKGCHEDFREKDD